MKAKSAFAESPVARADFYVTGGTLRPDAPSYVERRADQELCSGLLRGEFCYVLTSRQMGKSSLMIRTVMRLRQEGVAVAVLDLTAIGQNLTIEQWYDGLISRLGQQLDLEDEVAEFWNEHRELGPLQRWLSTIEEVILRRISSRIVIFVDEIDIVRSLPFSTDEFFAAIREVYNRRSREPGFERLAFGLLGVATPTDLIRDTRMTPFNIGRRIELNDFTPEEAAPLGRGLGPDEPAAQRLLARVLYWTGGHPYLTQRLCRALAESVQPRPSLAPPVPPVIPSAETVDNLAESLFLSRRARDRDDNLIFVRERVLRSEVDVPALLYLYRRILNHESVPDDETSPIVSVLRLSGITRNVGGQLRVRNRIYAHVFDHSWIQTNMPEAEVRRQKGARRKGVLIGLTIAVILGLGYTYFWPMAVRFRQARLARTTMQNLESAYRRLTTYRDSFESTLDIGLGGVTVPVQGSGSIVFHRPEMFNLVVRSEFSTPPTDLRVTSDGRLLTVAVPGWHQFKVSPIAESSPQFMLSPPLASQVGPIQLLPLYRLLLAPDNLQRFSGDAYNIRYEGPDELSGVRVRVLAWDHAATALLEGAGPVFELPRNARIPVRAWVSTEDWRVLQIRLDLSTWARQLIGDARELNISGLTLTETHRNIDVSTAPPVPVKFHMPAPGGMPVSEFFVPPDKSSTLSFLRAQFTNAIPARLPFAPSNLIDLSDYYNAPLTSAWHPGGMRLTLEALPTGLLQFGTVSFDVRGIVQLSGKQVERAGAHYPQAVLGIKIAQPCRELHFLHATGWRTRDGTRIGSYVVRYANGMEQVLPIVYGEDVRDWNAESDPSSSLKRANMVWNLIHTAAKGTPNKHIRLFKTSWVNPFPDLEVVSMDYVSTMSDAAPFLIAVTAEK